MADNPEEIQSWTLVQGMSTKKTNQGSEDSKECQVSKNEDMTARNKGEKAGNDSPSGDNRAKDKKKKSRKKKPWWTRYVPKDAVDPISLDPIKSLAYPPFALSAEEPYEVIPFWPTPEETQGSSKKASPVANELIQENSSNIVEAVDDGKEVAALEPLSKQQHRQKYIHLYDGRMLAYYLVSQLQFIDPLNRRDLTRPELQNLDKYLARHRLGKAHVLEAYDQLGMTKSKAGVAGQTAQGRADMLQEEARNILQSLFAGVEHQPKRSAIQTTRRGPPKSKSISKKGYEFRAQFEQEYIRHPNGMEPVQHEVPFAQVSTEQTRHDFLHQDAFPSLTQAINPRSIDSRNEDVQVDEDETVARSEEVIPSPVARRDWNGQNIRTAASVVAPPTFQQVFPSLAEASKTTAKLSSRHSCMPHSTNKFAHGSGQVAKNHVKAASVPPLSLSSPKKVVATPATSQDKLNSSSVQSKPNSIVKNNTDSKWGKALLLSTSIASPVPQQKLVNKKKLINSSPTTVTHNIGASLNARRNNQKPGVEEAFPSLPSVTAPPGTSNATKAYANLIPAGPWGHRTRASP